MRDLGLIPGLGRCPGKGKGYTLQYFGLENSMDWLVHGVAESQGLSDVHFHFQRLLLFALWVLNTSESKWGVLRDYVMGITFTYATLTDLRMSTLTKHCSLDEGDWVVIGQDVHTIINTLLFRKILWWVCIWYTKPQPGTPSKGPPAFLFLKHFCHHLSSVLFLCPWLLAQLDTFYYNLWKY